MTPIWKPTAEYMASANITRFMQRHGICSIDELISRSVTETEWFWPAVVEDLGIIWKKPYTRLLDTSRGFPWTRWFIDGELNIVAHCIDQHAKKSPNHPAVVWESDGGQTKELTYAELSDSVGKVAQVLIQFGIQPGDAVGVLMPMIPEVVISLFAIFKIGAVAIPIFSGFGAEAVAIRLNNAKAKMLLTTDGGYRRGKLIPIKTLANQVAEKVPTLGHILVVKHAGNDMFWNRNDRWWHDEFGKASPAPTRSLPAEHPCMVIYTSGTTGQPKGCVHTHAGVLVQTAKELAYHFDLKPEDRFFWFTDIGWMMGPWEMIGVLSRGATLFIYEGAPDYPNPDRIWQMIERHRLTHLGISPTAIRLLKKAGDQWVDSYSMPSLRILGSTGEPWDPDSYMWYFTKVGKEKAPIINISGGTELMGCLLAPLPIQPLTPCTLGGPALGMDVDVVNEKGEPVRDEIGYLVCRKPAPSMTKSFLNDDPRYLETYFSKWENIWNHGDWAKRDPEGYWYLYGRADDTIKVAGKRVGPNEVESALMAHAAVAEAAAIGVPHEIKGEGIVGFVILKADYSPTEQLRTELKEKVAAVLGKSLKAEEVRFVTALPKTRSAKILRGLIRKKFLNQPLGDTSAVENLEALDAISLAK